MSLSLQTCAQYFAVAQFGHSSCAPAALHGLCQQCCSACHCAHAFWCCSQPSTWHSRQQYLAILQPQHLICATGSPQYQHCPGVRAAGRSIPGLLLMVWSWQQKPTVTSLDSKLKDLSLLLFSCIFSAMIIGLIAACARANMYDVLFPNYLPPAACELSCSSGIGLVLFLPPHLPFSHISFSLFVFFRCPRLHCLDRRRYSEADQHDTGHRGFVVRLNSIIPLFLFL